MPRVGAQVGDPRLAAVDQLQADDVGGEAHRAGQVARAGAHVGDVRQLDHAAAPGSSVSLRFVPTVDTVQPGVNGPFTGDVVYRMIDGPASKCAHSGDGHRRSDESVWVTGQNISIDGGVTAGFR
ncbi:hypothetical protein Acsp06_16360 [Actinomycetospora sp. NBRC 106375]|nr:hypothetical protein Acsp06_16360 [Actinomycetospora sp. NBRC 106375]